MISHKMIALVLMTAGLASPAAAQLGSYNPEPGPRANIVIRGARIVPVSGPEIPVGNLVISDGRIQAIGANAAIPAGAEVIDGTGLSVYPGMMDAGTSMGLLEIEQGANATIDNVEVGRFNPNAQALWGIDPHSAHIGVTRVAGITHVISRPSGGIVSGQAALINLAGYTAPSMAVVPSVAMVMQLPSTGGGGRGFGGGAPATTTTSPSGLTAIDSLKRLLDDAEAYARAVTAYTRDNTLPRPTTDLSLAALGAVIRGEMPVIFVAESEADIKAVVSFAKERNIKPIILGGRDSWRMTDYLKEHDVAVLFSHTLTLPSREDDPYDANYSAASKLSAAGVRFAITSGEPNPDVRNLPYVAGMAAAFGLSPQDALRAVTLSPAEIFGVADRLGSLEVGKIANLVVTTGDLLEARTDTRHLIIDGRVVPLGTKHSQLNDTFKNRR
jgi:imidazolonepropionase-like amidohydrolase